MRVNYVSLICWLVSWQFIVLPQAFGQHETDNWLFGRKAGMTFSAQGLVPITNIPIDQLEGVACVSDPTTGQLLFYSDGRSVWDRTNQLMPNGQGLSGSQTSTQSALIVPYPGKAGLYYLFTVRAFNESGNGGQQGGLFYSLIDMSLRNGLGDVMQTHKNQLIERYTTEKLTAVTHANKRDFWVLSHAWDTDEFLVYRLTPAGIAEQKRIAIGTVHHAGIVGGSEAMGYLKASPNGSYLAAAVFGDARPFELYDFDAQTGVISNYRSLGNYPSQYGVSFSPNNLKLYLTSLGPEDPSYQFDLTSAPYKKTELTIKDTTKNGPVKAYIGGSLALGIDGRLYASAIETGRLVVINQPDAKAEACDPQYAPINFAAGKPLIGLPNFVQTIFNGTSATGPALPGGDECARLLSVYPNPLAGNQLTVDLDSLGCPLTKLTVYDESGRVISSYRPLNNKLFKIDVTSWAGALYLLVFEFNDQKIVKKVIKL